MNEEGPSPWAWGMGDGGAVFFLNVLLEAAGRGDENGTAQYRPERTCYQTLEENERADNGIVAVVTTLDRVARNRTSSHE